MSWLYDILTAKYDSSKRIREYPNKIDYKAVVAELSNVVDDPRRTKDERIKARKLLADNLRKLED